MRVLVTGLESSGTRLLTRLLLPACDAVHRSVPHGELWWDDPGDVQAAIVIVRAWRWVAPSQVEHGHMDVWPMSVQEKLQDAFAHLVSQVVRLGVPWTLTTYADLVRDPSGTVDSLCRFLRVATPRVTEGIYDGNRRRECV